MIRHRRCRHGHGRGRGRGRRRHRVCRKFQSVLARNVARRRRAKALPRERRARDEEIKWWMAWRLATKHQPACVGAM